MKLFRILEIDPDDVYCFKQQDAAGVCVQKGNTITCRVHLMNRTQNTVKMQAGHTRRKIKQNSKLSKLKKNKKQKKKQQNRNNRKKEKGKRGKIQWSLDNLHKTYVKSLCELSRMCGFVTLIMVG